MAQLFLFRVAAAVLLLAVVAVLIWGANLSGESWSISQGTARLSARKLAEPRTPRSTGSGSEIIAWSAVEPHLGAILPGDHPEAVMLDFVQQLIAWLGIEEIAGLASDGT